jgi:hypothetical protein
MSNDIIFQLNEYRLKKIKNVYNFNGVSLMDDTTLEFKIYEPEKRKEKNNILVNCLHDVDDFVKSVKSSKFSNTGLLIKGSEHDYKIKGVWFGIKKEIHSGDQSRYGHIGIKKPIDFLDDYDIYPLLIRKFTKEVNFSFYARKRDGVINSEGTSDKLNIIFGEKKIQTKRMHLHELINFGIFSSFNNDVTLDIVVDTESILYNVPDDILFFTHNDFCHTKGKGNTHQTLSCNMDYLESFKSIHEIIEKMNKDVVLVDSKKLTFESFCRKKFLEYLPFNLFCEANGKLFKVLTKDDFIIEEFETNLTVEKISISKFLYTNNVLFKKL